ncbi:MAG: hypothetical protein AB7P76_12985 [Candidatus Melainabacteria bacterium]
MRIVYSGPAGRTVSDTTNGAHEAFYVNAPSGGEHPWLVNIERSPAGLRYRRGPVDGNTVYIPPLVAPDSQPECRKPGFAGRRHDGEDPLFYTPPGVAPLRSANQPDGGRWLLRETWPAGGAQPRHRLRTVHELGPLPLLRELNPAPPPIPPDGSVRVIYRTGDDGSRVMVLESPAGGNGHSSTYRF